MNKKEPICSSMPFSAKVALFIACFFWAASFIATKKALDVVPPITLVTLRLLISALCFLAWFIYRREKIIFSGVKWLGRLFLLSLFGTGLHYGIQTIGLEYTTASNASVYAVTGPISITIIAALFLGEKITLKKALGIGCALLGVLIVIGVETLREFELKGHLLGDFLVFISIFLWGVFSVLGKDMTRQMGALRLTAAVTFMGALYMIPLGLIEIHKTSFSLSSISADAWIAITFLGITCSFLATLLYFFALEKTEAQKVGVYLYTIPPMTYVIAGVVLKEAIGFNLLIGSVIVFAGVYLTERG
jgi:drug/metabolite transporter (DMT)-like permease